MSKFNKTRVGKKAREVRERCGWSQTDVAAWSDIRGPRLCYIESGSRIASVEDLVKLSVTLRVTTDYLLGLK